MLHPHPQEVSVDNTYESWLSTYSEPVHSNKGGLVAEKVRQCLCPMERGDRVVLERNRTVSRIQDQESYDYTPYYRRRERGSRACG